MDVQKIQVGLEGLADICFDKFFDHSKEIRPANQKLYLFYLPVTSGHFYLGKILKDVPKLLKGNHQKIT